MKLILETGKVGLQPLVKRLNKGDKNAFEELYRLYSSKLYDFVFAICKSHEDSADVVQLVFLKIWETRSKIRPEESFTGLLFTIARNTVFNRLKQRIRQELKESVESSCSVQDNSTEDDVLFSELEDAVHGLIDELPPRRKEIFRLSRFEGLTYKEIARKLSITENTVDTQMRSALDFLRQNLKSRYTSLLFFLCVLLFDL